MHADVGSWALAGAVAAGAGGLLVRRWRSPATVAVAAALAVATASLLWALLTRDFTLAYVADTTSRASSWTARLAALWGGASGSMLAFAAVVAAAGAAIRRDAAVPVLVAGTALAAVTAVLAEPFARLKVPAIDGAGLAPILEHPAMLHHPPLLYGGLALTVIPFALALSGAGDPARLRRAGGLAWLVLGAGLLDGAHWAYQELGWGGFWAWDPVENGGLVPWLVLTALVHVAVVAERTGRGGRVLLALALAPFPLALVGAAVTRSGAVGSVHAFADGLGIGRALAGCAAVAAVAVAVSIVRAPAGTTGPRGPRALAVGVMATALVAGAAVVLAGVVYPFAVGLAGREAPVVQGWYFARLTSPVALVILALVGVGPTLPWRGRSRVGPVHAVAVAAGSATGIGVLAAGAPGAAAVASALGAAGLVVIAADRPGWQTAATAGSRLAHVGAIVLLTAVAASTAGTTRTISLAPGSGVDVAGRHIRHEAVSTVAEGRGVRVVVDLSVEGAGTLRPEQLVLPDRGIVLAEAALRSTPLEDVQVAIQRVADDGTVLAQVTVRPLVWWVWWGGLLVVAGGTVALLSRRRPASAAAGGRRSTAVAAAPV